MPAKLTALTFLLFASTAPLIAQATPERVLVPIALSDPVAGAYGSVWTSQLTVRNRGDREVLVTNIFPECGTVGCSNSGLIPPNETVLLIPDGEGQSGRRGSILEVDSSDLDNLAFSLRIQDLSRQATTWGTSIPVVREDRLLSGPQALVNIPHGPGFRSTLRVYEIDGLDGEFEVRLYAIEPANVGMNVPPKEDSLLGTKRFRLTPPPAGWSGRAPAYFELSDLAAVAEVGTADLLALEIVPVTPNLHYWAFVSITNDETQHVTTVVP